MTPQAKAAATRRRKRQAAQLVGREEQVYALLPTLTNEQIAERLGCSVSAVESAVMRLRVKLGVRSRLKLAQLARSQ